MPLGRIDLGDNILHQQQILESLSQGVVGGLELNTWMDSTLRSDVSVIFLRQDGYI